jgi:hypothetical protein
MLSRLSIATKVFGLAVLLLCLTAVLAGFLLWRVDLLQDKLEIISRREAPLPPPCQEWTNTVCAAAWPSSAGSGPLTP